MADSNNRTTNQPERVLERVLAGWYVLMLVVPVDLVVLFDRLVDGLERGCIFGLDSTRLPRITIAVWSFSR